MSELDQAKKQDHNQDVAAPPANYVEAPGKSSASGQLNGGSPKESGLTKKPDAPTMQVNLDDGQIAAFQATLQRVTKKLGQIGTSGADKVLQMQDMLTGKGGVLKSYDDMAGRYGDARGKFIESLKKHDEEKNKAQELADKIIEMGISKAVDVLIGPHGLALKETMAITGIGETVFDYVKDLGVGAMVGVASGKGPASNEAGNAEVTLESETLKKLRQTQDVLSLTTTVGARGANFAMLTGLLPAVESTSRSLQALSGHAVDQAPKPGQEKLDALLSSTECQRNVQAFAAIEVEAIKMEQKLNNLFARIKEMQNLATKQLFLTSNEAALRRLWSEYINSGGEAKPDEGLFGEQQLYPSGQGDGHHQEIQANLQIGRTAVAKTALTREPKGAVTVANQTFVARCFGGGTVAEGGSCTVIGVVPQTGILIVEPVQTDPATTSDNHVPMTPAAG